MRSALLWESGPACVLPSPRSDVVKRSLPRGWNSELFRHARSHCGAVRHPATGHDRSSAPARGRRDLAVNSCQEIQLSATGLSSAGPRSRRGTSCTSSRCRRGTGRSGPPSPPPSLACARTPARTSPDAPSSSARPSTYCRALACHLPLQPRRLLRLRPALHPHQLADELVVDGREHLDEALVAFLLVLLLRVLLAVAAQADALAQVVHRQQVVLPQLVDGGEVAVPGRSAGSRRRTPPRAPGSTFSDAW